MKPVIDLARHGAAVGTRSVATVAQSVRTAQGKAPERPAPWDADVIDDLAFMRPWNLMVKAARVRAKRRIDGLRRSETIIIVNWNTLSVLQDTLAAVRRLTPSSVPITVVDNGSTDGSKEWLKTQDVKLIAMPINVGHSIALDLAFYGCDTDIVVTIDSDAVPITHEWFDAIVEPIRSGSAVLSGARSSRNFVHPMAMAVDLRRFIEAEMSFQVYKMPGVTAEDEIWGVNAFDTAEWMSRMVAPEELHFLHTTPNRVAGLPGMTAGDVVYHHGGVTRSAESGLDAESYRVWQEALQQLLPE